MYYDLLQRCSEIALKYIDEKLDTLVDNCSDGLVEQRALLQAQSAYFGFDLAPYKEKIRKEMEEKRVKKNRLKLSRPQAASTSTAQGGKRILSSQQYFL